MRHERHVVETVVIVREMAGRPSGVVSCIHATFHDPD